MGEVERILSVHTFRLEPEVVPSEGVLQDVADQLGIELPASYLEFCRLGGLDDLRFKHRILGPAELVEAKRQLSRPALVPFADNGCGDLYCWLVDGSPEPEVVFLDHEGGSIAAAAVSFTAWLRASRF